MEKNLGRFIVSAVKDMGKTTMIALQREEGPVENPRIYLIPTEHKKGYEMGKKVRIEELPKGSYDATKQFYASKKK
jgi:hypothetical protein